MPPAFRPVRVWDSPTRLFHWLLAGCVIASVISAKIGGTRWNGTFDRVTPCWRCWHFDVCGSCGLARDPE